MIKNYKGILIDVDTIDDYNKFMISETDNYKATLREYEMMSSDNKEYNETVTYNDEQREFVDDERRG